MVRHKDIGPDLEAVNFASGIDGIGKELRCYFTFKKGLVFKAGECQVMGVTGSVETLWLWIFP